MNGSAELAERPFEALTVGMTVEEDVEWNAAHLDAFRILSGDEAPIHRDRAFAMELGMPGPILYGMFTALPFSRLLGCRLPGAYSVIHSLRFDFVAPVQLQERVRYVVSVVQLSPATRSVVLSLLAQRWDGSVVIRGRAQCGLLR